MDGQWPKEPKTMNLLESGLENEVSMSKVDGDHSRLVAGKNKTSSFMLEKFFSAKSEDGLFLDISFRLIQNYSS